VRILGWEENLLFQTGKRILLNGLFLQVAADMGYVFIGTSVMAENYFLK
jgi:hypothetical protein